MGKIIYQDFKDINHVYFGLNYKGSNYDDNGKLFEGSEHSFIYIGNEDGEVSVNMWDVVGTPLETESDLHWELEDDEYIFIYEDGRFFIIDRMKNDIVEHRFALNKDLVVNYSVSKTP